MEGENEENSCYSNDQQYFLDVCRAGEIEELKQFVNELQEAQFDWACISNSHDNFLHMLAANNLAEVFDYLFPLVAKRLPLEQLNLLTNKQNGTGNTPLHYAVITNSKEMVLKLLQVNADTSILNQMNRTPFSEAEEFDKIQIAEILAPLTKNNIEELKKGMQLMEVCNEDDSEEEQQENLQEKN